MERREFLLSSLGLLAVSSGFAQGSSLGESQGTVAFESFGQPSGIRKPNIIVILADDLGYADLGCQGCRDIPTPHIDSLAANGIRFTDGYANHPVCSPSRAGLLSGRYQHRFGFEHNSGPERYAAPNFGLPRDELTIAERLKKLEYATGMVGKWHVGFSEGLRPHERGFDYHYGFLSGAHTYLPENYGGYPDRLVRNGVPVEDEHEYLTDAFARESVAFIERAKDAPFLLYLAFNAVHAPLEATKAYEDLFPKITDPKRRTYAAMTAAMDDAVGRVLAKLRDYGLEENTLIFFYSDNGGPTPQTTSSNAPLRGYKGQVLEGGIRVPFLVQWKGTLPAGVVYPHMIMGFDVHATALAAAGGGMPADKPLDGVNLLPFLTGKQEGAPHERLLWRSGQQSAVRDGDWKLVQVRGQQPQLYDLKDDIGESRDMAREKPELLRQLQSAYAEWDRQMMPAQWVRQDARSAGSSGRKGSSAAGRGGTLQERFNQLDRNRDGRVSAAEFPRADAFQRMDADGDGFVTVDEARRYYQRHRQQEGNEL